jgi:hypothetical protein
MDIYYFQVTAADISRRLAAFGGGPRRRQRLEEHHRRVNSAGHVDEGERLDGNTDSGSG